MNILMVSARFLPLLGGVETHIAQVGRRMHMLGHRVTLVTTDPSGVLPKIDSQEGMLVKRVRAWPKHRDYYVAPGIYREIGRRRDYDIVHFQGYNTFVPIIGIPAAIRFGLPFVVTFHSGGHPSRLRNAIRGVQQKALSPLMGRAAKLIAVSEFEADLMAKGMGIDRGRFVVIRNGADLPPPGDPAPVTNPHLILSIGRLERYKGHHRAIQAMWNVIRRVPDAHLMIVGSGPYELELRRLAQSLAVHRHVSFTSVPPDQRQEFSRLLHTAGLVVLLSEYEANPVAVMEALGARRRVLVAYSSGMRELADAGWCRAIRLDQSMGDLSDAIATELQSDRQQTAQFAGHSWDDCARQLLGVYDAVIGGEVTRSIEALS